MSEPASVYTTESSEESRAQAFTDGDITVAVYGLGKMGLPLAAVYAEVSGNVIGVDVDPSVTDAINAGDCPVSGEPGLPELVAEMVEEDALRATTDITDAAESASIHVPIVPTLLTDQQEPDLSILTSLLKDVAPHLDEGDAVFVESTLPPGTARNELSPLLEEHSPVEIGEFGLAFCPERTSSGRALKDIRGAYPKVVGGIDQKSTTAARIVYEELNDAGVIPVTNATTAEVVKITEGLYRDVNIALVNELASLADRLPIDFREVRTATNTIPFITLHEPGAGVGGHCIPYYPYFVVNRFDDEFPLLRTARRQNDAMPDFTVDRLEQQLGAVGQSLDGSRVVVLGVTYRPGVAETRATPARRIVERLCISASDVLVADPVLDPDETTAFGGTHLPTAEIETVDADAVVVVTAHEEFEAIDWSTFDPMVIVNGRPSLSIETDRHRVYTVGSGLESEGRF